jgi:hypothetical protein
MVALDRTPSDFAEPDVVAGLGESGFGVGGHLLEPAEHASPTIRHGKSGISTRAFRGRRLLP